MTRNLLEYPITKADVLECLDRYIEEDRAKQTVGGLDGIILQELRDLMETTPDELIKSLFLLRKMVDTIEAGGPVD